MKRFTELSFQPTFKSFKTVSGSSLYSVWIPDVKSSDGKGTSYEESGTSWLMKVDGSRLVKTLSVALYDSFAKDCRSLLQPVDDTSSTALANVLGATRSVHYHTYVFFLKKYRNWTIKANSSVYSAPPCSFVRSDSWLAEIRPVFVWAIINYSNIGLRLNQSYRLHKLDVACKQRLEYMCGCVASVYFFQPFTSCPHKNVPL